MYFFIHIFTNEKKYQYQKVCTEKFREFQRSNLKMGFILKVKTNTTSSNVKSAKKNSTIHSKFNPKMFTIA